jgi:hypothetical protein
MVNFLILTRKNYFDIRGKKTFIFFSLQSSSLGLLLLLLLTPNYLGIKGSWPGVVDQVNTWEEGGH